MDPIIEIFESPTDEYPPKGKDPHMTDENPFKPEGVEAPTPKALKDAPIKKNSGIAAPEKVPEHVGSPSHMGI